MRALSIDQLKPGQAVGRALLDERGQVLLQKGVQLTDAYIRALREKGYTLLYVREEEIEVEVEIDEDLTTALRSDAVSTLHNAYRDIGRELTGIRQQSLKDMHKAVASDCMRALVGRNGPLAGITGLTERIIEEILSRSTLAGLTSIKSRDARLYEHSIDVCVVALMIGRSVNLPHARMRQLAVGCLLHDIGKLFINADLPENERVRQHTLLGYELLKGSDDPDIMAPHVAYEHHERQDGTGLPRGLKGSNKLERDRAIGKPVITLIGEVAAVANLYDNMLSGPGGAKSLQPDAALADIARMAGTALNREVVGCFRKVVPVYPRGTQVLMEGKPYNGYLAVVSRVIPGRLDRPWVILGRDGMQRRVTPKEIDTAAFPGLTLSSVGL
jgi:putative nucleotidyltransferase with HDIG domain